MLASYNDFRALAPRYFINQTNLLSQELYQEADTLFVILDDPRKWPDGINSDIWEINVFESKKIADQFNSADGTKIIKLVK